MLTRGRSFLQRALLPFLFFFPAIVLSSFDDSMFAINPYLTLRVYFVFLYFCSLHLLFFHIPQASSVVFLSFENSLDSGVDSYRWTSGLCV